MRSPERPPTPLEIQTNDLFALLSAKFEEFSTAGYVARLDLPVKPSSKIFDEDDPSLVNIYATTLFDRKIDNRKPWRVEIGFVPETDKISLQALVLPLTGSSDAFVMKRTPENVFNLYLRKEMHASDSKPGQTLEEPVEGHTLSEREVVRTFAIADYSLPELFTAPDDMRLALSELSNKAVSWVSSETKLIHEDAEAKVILTRTISCDRQSKENNEMHTELYALRNLYSQGNVYCDQHEIHFSGTKYEVGLPKLTHRTFVSNSELPGVPEMDGYSLISEVGILPTLKVLSLHCENFVDILSSRPK